MRENRVLEVCTGDVRGVYLSEIDRAVASQRQLRSLKQRSRKNNGKGPCHQRLRECSARGIDRYALGNGQ
jgi:hypothetical protein